VGGNVVDGHSCWERIAAKDRPELEALVFEVPHDGQQWLEYKKIIISMKRDSILFSTVIAKYKFGYFLKSSLKI
jgi:hypothetical protein